MDQASLISINSMCRLKRSREQVDDRIVEVHWDPELSRWRMMRFRDDKPHGNHKSVVEMIIQSIADGVEKEAVSFSVSRSTTHLPHDFEQLLERCAPIRNAWKARMSQSSSMPSSTSTLIPNRPPPPHAHPQNPVSSRNRGPSVLRYGPIAQSPWSRVAGPREISGMRR